MVWHFHIELETRLEDSQKNESEFSTIFIGCKSMGNNENLMVMAFISCYTSFNFAGKISKGV